MDRQAEVIDLYEELVENLHQLYDDVPKIKSMYTSFQEEMQRQRSALQESISKAKEDLLQAETDGKKKLTDLSSTRKKQIDNSIKALEDIVQKAGDLERSLGLAVGATEHFSEQLADLVEMNNHLEDLMKGEQKRLDRLEQTVSLLEFRLKQLLPNTEIDFDEVAPAIDLFCKYEGRIGRPVVLEKKSWTKEYCFKVTGVDEEHQLLLGRYYQMGQPYGQKTTLPYSEKCRMFNKSTLANVISEGLESTED